MLTANVRQDWKVIARYKHSSLFGLVISNEGKEFYNIDARRLEKNCQIFRRIAYKVAKSKKGQNIYNKTQFQSPKHLPQTTFETLKYLQQTMF